MAMEYVIPYLRIDELRDLSHTCKEYNEMINHYLSTKKKHTIKGYFNKDDFEWLMSKMTSLTHLTIENQWIYGYELFDTLPATLETLIRKYNVYMTWNTDTGRIEWHLPSSLENHYSEIRRVMEKLEHSNKVFPFLKHIELIIEPTVGVECLYNPLVDGYDEYGPKYDYSGDYVETELLTDSIPLKKYYDKYTNVPISKRVFPALERFILPEAKEAEPHVSYTLLESLPWKYYKSETTEMTQ